LLTVVVVAVLVWVTISAAESRNSGLAMSNSGLAEIRVGPAGAGTAGDQTPSGPQRRSASASAGLPAGSVSRGGSAAARPPSATTPSAPGVPTGGRGGAAAGPLDGPTGAGGELATATGGSGLQPGATAGGNSSPAPGGSSAGGTIGTASPADSVGGPDLAAGQSTSTVLFRAVAGQVLLSCSATGISDLRAVTELGWSGRWELATSSLATVWFTRNDKVLQLSLSCSAGVASIRDVSQIVLPSTRSGSSSTSGGRSVTSAPGTDQRGGHQSQPNGQNRSSKRHPPLP
jgi:hypothetical protein